MGFINKRFKIIFIFGLAFLFNNLFCMNLAFILEQEKIKNKISDLVKSRAIKKEKEAKNKDKEDRNKFFLHRIKKQEDVDIFEVIYNCKNKNQKNINNVVSVVKDFLETNLKCFENGKNLINESNSNAFAFGETILNAACYKGVLPVVSEIVEFFINNNLTRLINAPSRVGRTPIACACDGNCFDVVKYLNNIGFYYNFDFKINSNYVTEEMHTALYFACLSDNFEIVSYLVKRMNAYIDQKCIDCARNNKNKEIFGFLEKAYFIQPKKTLGQIMFDDYFDSIGKVDF